MDRNHSVTVVTLNNKIKHADNYDFAVHRLPAVHFSVRNYFKHFRISSLFPRNYLRLNRIARDSHADVILLINHYLDIAFLAVVVSKFAGIPLICSVGTQLQSSNPRRDRILNFLDRLICGNLIFPFCDRIVAWDNQILQYLQDVHGSKVVDKSDIINYGVNGDMNFFLSQSHDYFLYNQILGVGAVIEQRNFMTLIRAFKDLAAEYPAVQLKIIGHIYYDAAVKLVNELDLVDRVTFTGEIHHTEVLKEISQSDLYFVSLTGKYLGLGTATIESMLLGVPTIANVPANLLGNAVLRDMDNIVLIGGASHTEIASKIGQLLSDQSLRKKIGQRGREFVMNNMSWERVARDMDELLVKVSGSRKKHRA